MARLTLTPEVLPLILIDGALIYNGIRLEITTVREYRKQAIYFQGDYLYTKHTLSVRAIYNPRATAYFPPVEGMLNNRPLDPIRRPNGTVSPGMTDAAIRSHLLEPRRSLWWVLPTWNGDVKQSVVVLKSPDPLDLGATVDCANGPIPLECNVVQVQGSKTFLVDFVIETYLNESTGFEKSLPYPPPLLSNRWTMAHEIDGATYLTTRIIRGRATFRTDVMALIGANPDDYREHLFFPIPYGFRREDVKVEQSADGTAVDYQITDAEQAISIVPSLWRQYGVISIEGRVSVGWNKLGLSDLPSAAWSGAKKGAVVGFAVGGVKGSVIGGVVGGGAGLISGALPSKFGKLDLALRGDRTSDRARLSFLAVLMFERITSPFRSYLTTDTVELVHSIMEKYVELHATMDIGAVGSFASTQTFQTGTLLDRFPIRAEDELEGITIKNPAENGIGPGNLRNKSRGTHLAALVHAALQPYYQGNVAAYPPANTHPSNYTPRTIPK